MSINGLGKSYHRQIDIESSLNQSDTRWKPLTGISHEIRLYHYNDSPRFLQGNPYIRRGYRAYLTINMCFQSLFVWNNESMNMWTHLIGFIIFFVLMIHDNLVVIPQIEGTWMDHFIMTVGLLCYQFCMLCSTGYHMFRCRSEQHDSAWLAYDLTGISIGLLGCYLPGVHYAFYCLSIWRDIYLIVIAVLFGSVLLCQTQPQYYTDKWYHRRVVLYCGLALYGVIPTMHWIYLNGGFDTDIVQTFYPKVAVVYLLGMMAFLFYLTKYPEKCCPGNFDYCGASHQLWHIIVVVTFLWWHESGLELQKYQRDNACLHIE